MKLFNAGKEQQGSKRNFGRDILLGIAVGDALGVPVEFKDRQELKVFPVKDMQGYGTHNQPVGTWSDDSSLTFCLAEELLSGFDLYTIGQSFRRWYYENHWTPHGEVFDIGNSTLNAIERLGIKGIQPELAGGMGENENGNGSLMRILPIAFYVKDLPKENRHEIVKKVSSLTHAHFRSFTSCFIYIELALELMEGYPVSKAFKRMLQKVKSFLKEKDCNPAELKLFERVLSPKLGTALEMDIRGSGYVIHSLEASIWCLLTTRSYEEAVLKAVNLGEDTDTTGAITGGLAGLVYGYNKIPDSWISQLVRRNDIEKLADNLNEKFT
ncbi:MAG: ADP-ribosylglycohydrolase family protein [Bacteroidota bacterium]